MILRKSKSDWLRLIKGPWKPSSAKRRMPKSKSSRWIRPTAPIMWWAIQLEMASFWRRSRIWISRIPNLTLIHPSLIWVLLNLKVLTRNINPISPNRQIRILKDNLIRKWPNNKKLIFHAYKWPKSIESQKISSIATWLSISIKTTLEKLITTNLASGSQSEPFPPRNWALWPCNWAWAWQPIYWSWNGQFWHLPWFPSSICQLSSSTSSFNWNRPIPRISICLISFFWTRI